MATITVKDASGATQTIERPLAPGRAAASVSRPVALSNEDAAFLDGIETLLGTLGTQTTLAAILAKIIAAPATEAKQPSLGTAGSPSANVISVQGVASGTAQPVSGTVSIDSAQVSALGQAVSAASMPVVPPSDYGVPLETNKMQAGTTALTPKFAAIAVASSGDNSIVALVSLKKIRVLALKITAAGAVNAKWRSNTTDKTGLSYLAAAGDGEVLPFNPVGWFETAAGEALQVNLSAAVAVGGHITYVEV